MSDVCGLCGTPISQIDGFLEHMMTWHRIELERKLGEFIVSEVDI